MPSGGYRPGGGRPRGSKDVCKRAKSVKKELQQQLAKASKKGLSPLDYMLSVMRDGSADVLRRDRMAMAAAPFLHAKQVLEQRIYTGKREAENRQAQTAHEGTGWGDVLN